MSQSERDFLIKLAVDKYNDQYSTDLVYSDFTIRSIPPNFNTSLGYEIQTDNQLDFLRLRVYLIFGNNTILYDYKLENDTQTGHGTLIDEVFVTLGTMSNYYKVNGIYKFQPIREEDAWTDSILLTEDLEFIITEDGFPLSITV